VCLARVVATDPEESTPPIADVAYIQPTDGGLLVIDLLGNRHTVRGTIESIDFLESTVLVRRRKE
jgi:predicted RNA-binding protein